MNILHYRQPLSLLQPHFTSSKQAAEESGSVYHTGIQDKFSLFNVKPYSSREGDSCGWSLHGSPYSSLIGYTFRSATLTVGFFDASNALLLQFMIGQAVWSMYKRSTERAVLSKRPNNGKIPPMQDALQQHSKP